MAWSSLAYQKKQLRMISSGWLCPCGALALFDLMSLDHGNKMQTKILSFLLWRRINRQPLSAGPDHQHSLHLMSSFDERVDTTAQAAIGRYCLHYDSAPVIAA
jgi:hypothetical protein